MTSFGGSRDAATSRQRVTIHHVKGGKTRVISIIDDEYLSKDTAKRESMVLQDPAFENVIQLAKQLTPGQKLRLIAAIAPDLAEPLRHAEGGPQPLKSVYGLWQDFGIDLSAEEIDEARREMWGTFPRDDR